jgi:uncharacterized protein involved in exopolysaccharide biosynthesis
MRESAAGTLNRGDDRDDVGRRAFRPLQRFHRTLVAGAILVVVLSATAAFLFAQTRSPVYEARSDVLIDLGVVGSQAEADRMLASVVVLATSRAVLEPAATRLGVEATQLEERVKAEVVQRSQIFRISAVAPDPEEARETVEAVTDVLVERTAGGNVHNSGSAAAAAMISEQIEELTAKREDLERQLADLERTQDDPAEYRVLSARAETIKDQLASLHERLIDRQLELASSPQLLEVLAPAYVGDRTGVNAPVRAAAIGTLVGLVLASAVLVGGWRLGYHRSHEATL